MTSFSPPVFVVYRRKSRWTIVEDVSIYRLAENTLGLSQRRYESELAARFLHFYLATVKACTLELSSKVMDT